MSLKVMKSTISRATETDFRDQESQSSPVRLVLFNEEQFSGINWKNVRFPLNINDVARIRQELAIKDWNHILPDILARGDKWKYNCVVKGIEKRHKQFANEDYESEVFLQCDKERRILAREIQIWRQALINRIEKNKLNTLKLLITNINTARSKHNRDLFCLRTKHKVGLYKASDLCLGMKRIKLTEKVIKERQSCTVCSRLSYEQLQELMKELSHSERQPCALLKYIGHLERKDFTPKASEYKDISSDYRSDILMLKRVILGRTVQTELIDLDNTLEVYPGSSIQSDIGEDHSFALGYLDG